MPKVVLTPARTRLIVEGDVRLPPSLLPFENSRRKTVRMPVCRDVLRRLVDGVPGIEVSGEAQEAVDAVTARTTSAHEAFKAAEIDDPDPRLLLRQRSGVAWLIARKRALLADSQGTGKTVIAIQAATRVGRRIVVVCSNVKRRDWVDHVHAWSCAEARIVDASDIPTEVEDGVILVMGYAAAERHLKRLRADVLIVDEAHRYRNRKTSGTKALISVAKRFKHVYLLTATPVVNGPDDVWPLLRLLDPDRFPSYWEFAMRFLHVDKGYFGVKVGGLRDEEESNYHQLLSEYMLQRGKDESTLPVLHRRIVKHRLVGEHEEIYRQMSKQSAATYDGVKIEAVEVVAQITRLRQIAVSPALVWPSYQGPSKLDALGPLLTETPVVVFSMFAEATDLIVERFPGAEALNGSLSAPRREDLLARFDAGKVPILAVTHQTGGEGLNLVTAARAVLLDLHWHPAGNAQARDRIYRIGQKADEIEVVYLHAEGTIEDEVLEILRRKEPATVEALARRLSRY